MARKKYTLLTYFPYQSVHKNKWAYYPHITDIRKDAKISQNNAKANKRGKKEHLFGKQIIKHRVRVNLHYLYSTYVVTLITQHSAILVNFLEKFSEELYMIYHELLVPLLETLDE